MFWCGRDVRWKLRRDEPNHMRFARGQHAMPIRVLHGRNGDAGGELRRQGGVPGGADDQLRAEHLFGDGVRGRLFRQPAVRGRHLLRRRGVHAEKGQRKLLQ